jgi:TrmH family RNA methyltransferase
LDRVVLSPDCADVFSPKVIHASMGSFSRVAVHTAELPAALANSRATVFGCDLEGEDVHRMQPARDAVIVVGSEGRGLSAGVSKRVTIRLSIPRYGRAESLNAAIAAAVVCDNLRRALGPC